MRINNLSTSLMSINKLAKASSGIDGSVKKLTSGRRINGSADDAAGLALSSRLSSQRTSLSVTQRNIQDGISLVQTAEGALDELHQMLNRIVNLSVQSSTDTYAIEEKHHMVEEARQIKAGIEDIINKTSFNGVSLLQGDTIKLQTGINNGDSLDLTMPDMTHLVRHIIIKDNPIDNIAAPEDVREMIDDLSAARASLGAFQNRLEHTLSSATNHHFNISSAESRITDTDMAIEVSKKAKHDIIASSSSSILSTTMSSSHILNLLN